MYQKAQLPLEVASYCGPRASVRDQSLRAVVDALLELLNYLARVCIVARVTMQCDNLRELLLQ